MPDAATYDTFTPAATMRECPHCGLFQEVPALRPNQVAECGRCHALLRRRRRDSVTTVLALNVAGLVLFAVVLAFPFMGFSLLGRKQLATLEDLPAAFDSQGMWQLAAVVFATTVLAPLCRLVLTVAVLVGLRWRVRPSLLAGMMRLRRTLQPWAMIEVFLLGVLVAYTRLAATATVLVGPALYALAALMLVTVASDAWLDEDAVWDAIGRLRHPDVLPGDVAARPDAGSAPPGEEAPLLIGCDSCGRVTHAVRGTPCPRCDVPLEIRKRSSVARSWAFLIAAAVLYVPANLYPILTLIRFGRGHPSTILGGVRELVEYRMWPLAALVFVASILVPLLKLVGLALLLVLTSRGSGRRLRDRTRLYRLVDAVGRWSMIDMFMLAVLVALVRMQLLASVTPGIGAICFASVVVLTMLSAFAFDPRLMWDTAGQTACDAAEAEP